MLCKRDEDALVLRKLVVALGLIKLLFIWTLSEVLLHGGSQFDRFLCKMSAMGIIIGGLYGLILYKNLRNAPCPVEYERMFGDSSGDPY